MTDEGSSPIARSTLASVVEAVPVKRRAAGRSPSSLRHASVAAALQVAGWQSKHPGQELDCHYWPYKGVGCALGQYGLIVTRAEWTTP